MYSMIAEFGRIIKDHYFYERLKAGFQVLFFGPPNSGKSSLMNYIGTKN